MAITFRNVFLICVLDSAVSNLTLYLYLETLPGSSVRHRPLLWMFPLITAVGSGLSLWQAMGVLNYELLYAFSSIVVYGIHLLFVWRFWERSLPRACTYLNVAAILQVGTGIMVYAFLGELNVWDPSQAALFLGISVFGYVGLGLLGRFLVLRARLPERIRSLMEQSSHPWRVAAGVMGLELLCESFLLMREVMELYFFGTYFIGALLLIVGILFVLVYFSMKAETEARLQAQAALLAQQNLYVQSLERMQREMRAFRHDYKNMMSGLYLSAREGDLEPVRQLLQSMEQEFDGKVGEDIRRMTQLGNIRLIEVKGLLLTKLNEMQKQEVACRLEALYPVSRIDMELLDVTRCLGILLDNAMEAARETAVPCVDILISSLERGVSIVVKNPVKEEPALNRIWENGYSTRGEGRGLGLANYRRITEKYPNVQTETRCHDGEFVQEWRIEYRRMRG